MLVTAKAWEGDETLETFAIGEPGRPLPKTPTRFLPGTWEKIEVMKERLAAGYHLHHPDDAGFDGLSSGMTALAETVVRHRAGGPTIVGGKGDAAVTLYGEVG